MSNRNRYLIPCPAALAERGVRSSPLVVAYHTIVKMLEEDDAAETQNLSDEQSDHVEAVLDALNKDAYIAHLEDVNDHLGEVAESYGRQAVEALEATNAAADALLSVYGALDTFRAGVRRVRFAGTDVTALSAESLDAMLTDTEAARQRLRESAFAGFGNG